MRKIEDLFLKFECSIVVAIYDIFFIKMMIVQDVNIYIDVRDVNCSIIQCVRLHVYDIETLISNLDSEKQDAIGQ